MENTTAKNLCELAQTVKEADVSNVSYSIAGKLADALKGIGQSISKLNGPELVTALGIAGICLLGIITVASGYELEWSGEYGDASARILLRKE